MGKYRLSVPVLVDHDQPLTLDQRRDIAQGAARVLNRSDWFSEFGLVMFDVGKAQLREVPA